MYVYAAPSLSISSPRPPPSFRFFHSFQRGYERLKSGKRDTREGGHERNTITALYFFDSEITVGDLPFEKEGNDTLFTYFGLRKWFYLWLNHNYSMKRRIDDEIMISAKDSTVFPSPLSLPPSLWGNDVAKYFNDLELVIKRSHFGFWSLVDIRGHS